MQATTPGSSGSQRPNFLNFQVDHMTMLMTPEMYNVYYLVFRIVFGCSPNDIIYEKRKEWVAGTGEKSLTYALNLGDAVETDRAINKTLVAAVQPSEPVSSPSHVRSMLSEHKAASHWQHVALRTPDLIKFHEHALSLGVRFVTPIMRDTDEDVIQVFSGEWYHRNSHPSALFFEFVQRDVTPELLKKMEERNRETLFRDKTFLGLYGVKEKEYQSGKITPFIDFSVFDRLYDLVGNKNQWEITEDDVSRAEEVMRTHADKYPGVQENWST